MNELAPVPNSNFPENQPPAWQWLLVAGIGLLAICGVFSFVAGGVLTVSSWYEGQQAESTETAAAATAVVTEKYTALETASRWPLIIFDPFNDNTHDWIIGPIDDEYAQIEVTLAGRYVWNTTAKQGLVWRVWPGADIVRDFYLGVDVQNLGSNDDAQYGLIFHNDDQSYYYFEVRDTGYGRVLLWDATNWTELIPSTYSEALRAGDVNRLEMVAENSRLLFFINGQFLAETWGRTPSQGQCGVAIGLSGAGEQSQIAFDNFELRGVTIQP